MYLLMQYLFINKIQFANIYWYKFFLYEYNQKQYSNRVINKIQLFEYDCTVFVNMHRMFKWK